MNQEQCRPSTYIRTYYAAKILDVCPRMVLWLMKNHQLTGYRRGPRIWMFNRDEVNDLKAKRERWREYCDEH